MPLELFRTANFSVLKDGTDIGCTIVRRLTGTEVAHLQGEEYLDLRDAVDNAPNIHVQDDILSAYDY